MGVGEASALAGNQEVASQGEFEPEPAWAAYLPTRGVTIERSPVVELLGTALDLEAVRLADGRVVPVAALFTAARMRMTSPLGEQLVCALDEGPMGPRLRVHEFKKTTVPGFFAAGDAATPMHNATLAPASGVMAGVCVHRALIGMAA